MPYRIIALDIDGTLARNDKTISPKTIETLLLAQQKGLKIVLATGRPTPGVRHIVDQLHLKRYGGYVLAFNGGRIYDCATDDLLHSVSLPPDVIPYLYNKSKLHKDFVIISYKGDEIVTESPEYPYVMHASYINRMPLHQVPDFVAETTYPLPKCMIVGNPEPLHDLELEIQADLQRHESPVFPNRIGVFRSEPFFLELVPAGIDKAQCLDILLNKIGYKREELISCGDGFNDISMIRYAGLGVAMQNAQQCVKDAADIITCSNEEDGVAKIVQKYFLKKD